jgi:hypothetical protein
VILAPDGAPFAEPVAGPALYPEPVRPGLFGWRRKHAEHKRHMQEKVLGYPEEFNEWPLGRSLYAMGRTEVANGAAARLILNHYDFVGQTTELNQRGRDKLAAIAARLPATFDPVIVERTPWAPQLGEMRRSAIVGQLAQGSFAVPPERVVVGPAIAVGLRGVEAQVVNANRFYQFAGSNGGGSVAGSGLDAAGISGGLGPGGVAPR